MNKENFELVKQIRELRQGGVQEACLKVKEYLLNLDNPDNAAVTREEFIDSVNILMNYSYENSNKDTIVEECYCEYDCRMNTEFNVCKGTFSVSGKGKKLCKYYQGPSS